MWVSGAKLALFCLLHSGKGGAMHACVCMDVLSCFCLLGLGLCVVDCYHKAQLFWVTVWAVLALEEDKRWEFCVVILVKILIWYYVTSLTTITHWHGHIMRILYSLFT